MRLGAGGFSGRVTFVTGPEKHCGKTTLLNAALGLLRESGEKPAFLGVGFDGEARDALSGGRKPRIRAERGEIFVTAERYLESSPCLPEILDVVPGSTALGRLAIARSLRGGEVAIVGPERNEYAAWAIGRITSEGWARSVVVDGAINRITQVSAFSGARFLFALRVSPSEMEKQIRRMRLLGSLSGLKALRPAAAPAGVASVDAASIDAKVEAAGLPTPAFLVEGPLTAATAAAIPETAKTVVVEDFTKIFLDLAAFEAFQRTRSLAVLSGFEFAGFVVVLRDISRASFLDALDDRELEELVAFNPYEREALDA